MEKILITGTGRCGTTFLIKIFSFLEFDTGFTRKNYHIYISKNCNAGMERNYNEKYKILKNPRYIMNMEHIANDPKIKIKYVIIPIRKLEDAAMSRVKNKYSNGGLWKSKNYEEQIYFYNNILANYNYIMVKYDINTIFLDFEKIITDPNYLFQKLEPILIEKNINFEKFLTIYEEVSLTCKPTNNS